MTLSARMFGKVSVSALVLVAATGAAQAQWSQNGSIVFYNGGKVGIGTSAPFGLLHVVGTSNGVGMLRGDNAGTGPAIFGYSTATSDFNYGLLGSALSPNGRGVWGIGAATTGDSIGVRGTSYSATGYGGVFDGGQYGLLASSASPGGATVGVWGQVTSPDGWGGVFKGGRYGVWGEANGAGRYAGYFLGGVYVSGNLGVGTTSPTSPLTVIANTGSAIYGRVNNGSAILGETTGSNSTAIRGTSTSTDNSSCFGVQGLASSTNGVGVYGASDSTAGTPTGVVGTVNSANGVGVQGENVSATGIGFGVYGRSLSGIDGYGVFSEGRFGATGTKNFKIDHPLDPANKFLNHFSAEGPEPFLMYRGNAELDSTGEAWVQLPEYFEAINRDFHYQLTPIGAPALVYVAEEVKDNQFKIAGGKPGMRVSWTVTGVRNDRYVQAHPMAAEQEKPAGMKGRFLQPQLWGEPAGSAIVPQRSEAMSPSPMPQSAAAAPAANPPVPSVARPETPAALKSVPAPKR